MGCVQSAHDKGASGGVQGDAPNEDAAQAAAAVLGTTDFTSLVEVSVSCKQLPRMDIASKSDPMAVLYQSGGYGQANWAELGRTDIIQNSHDPNFTRALVCRYTFEQLQPMRVVVFDVDTSAKRPEDLNLAQQDYIGQAEFMLSDLMTAPAQTLTLPLRSVTKQGRQLPQGCCVTLNAEELVSTNATVTLAFSATGLDNVDRFSKSDPFLRVLKLREGGDWVPVLKTEVIDNNLNPAWRPISVDIRQLCNADEERPLRLEVLDYESSGAHKLIGECQTSLASLRALAASPAPTLDLLNPKKAGRPGYRHSGVLAVREVTVRPRPSFLQYIAAGLEVSFMVAIDFTGSNGDPRNPSSLHYLSPSPTPYEQAIMAVGQVLEHYDTDKNFPVWGFGAALPPSGAVSHCFAVGGTAAHPEVEGVRGILAAYRNCLPSIKLSGPTLFAPIVNTAASIARQAAGGPRLHYYVLLILTDGAIMDMQQTVAAVVEASRLPLSLLIVGVGQADFSSMEVLDADKKALRANGKTAARDIVQFVPLTQTQRQGGATAVAKELLAEIPGQVVGYYETIRGVLPPGWGAGGGARGGEPSAAPSGQLGGTSGASLV